MSVSRALSRTCCLLSRGNFISRAVRPALSTSQRIVPQRQIASTPKLWQEAPRSTSTGKNARSIVVLRLPARASRSEIEAFFRSKGLEIQNMMLRLDRFTFQNDKRCFIELANEQQARQAVEKLNNADFMYQGIVVQPLKEDFVWGSQPEKTQGLGGTRYFYETEMSASDAIKPLLEGRRMMFSVQTPGWGDKHNSIGHNKISTAKIEEHLGKFGIETVGGIQPFFGDLKPGPRLLCFIDFATKQGAEQAAAAVHKTEIDGRQVWLRTSELAPWRAHQIGKVDKPLLAELQEKGLAPKETYEDNFVNSNKKKGSKKSPRPRTQTR